MASTLTLFLRLLQQKSSTELSNGMRINLTLIRSLNTSSFPNPPNPSNWNPNSPNPNHLNPNPPNPNHWNPNSPNPNPSNPNHLNPNPSYNQPWNSNPSNPNYFNPNPPYNQTWNPNPPNTNHLNPNPSYNQPWNPDPPNPNHLNPNSSNHQPWNPNPSNPNQLDPNPSNHQPWNPNFPNSNHLNPNPSNHQPWNPNLSNPNQFNPNPSNNQPWNPQTTNPNSWNNRSPNPYHQPPQNPNSQSQFPGSSENEARVSQKGPEITLPPSTTDLLKFSKEGKIKEIIKALEEGSHPDFHCFMSFFEACGGSKLLEDAKKVHDFFLRSAYRGDLQLNNKVLEMYSKCGSMVDARRVFDHMPDRSTDSWHLMIHGYAENSMGDEGLQLYEDMRSAGLRPDGETFSAVLAACAGAHAVEEGFIHFESMKTEYGITPGPINGLEDELLGDSRPILELRKLLGKLAPTESPVLIRGESGTGKELVARTLHRQSQRCEMPFIAINCGAIPEHLIQSELFGHEKGAFTGAHQRKAGRIEAAHGGTLFLDEIGDLPLELQANLLRFLQEKHIERVGGSQPIPVDVRVLAATHVDLEKAIEQGRFREDLYYRLNVLQVVTAPLRDRHGDLSMLANHFSHFYSLETGRRPRTFSDHALAAMGRHNWPGNVRELANRVRRGLVLAEGRQIEAQDLGLQVLEQEEHPLGTLEDYKHRAERQALCDVLDRHSNNLSIAAKVLGVSRPTFYRLLHKHQIR